MLDFDTKSMSMPVQIEWCGEDAVALLWRSTGIVIVGPYGDCLVLPYEEDIHIVPEQVSWRSIIIGYLKILNFSWLCKIH